MTGSLAAIAVAGGIAVASTHGSSSSVPVQAMQRVAATTGGEPTSVARAVTSGTAAASTTKAVPVPSKSVAPTVATTLTLTAEKATVTAAQAYRAVLHGVLTASKKPLANQQVLLLEQRTGSMGWTSVGAPATTTKTGTVAFAVLQTNPSENFKLVYSGKGANVGSVSATVTVART